MTQKPVDPLRVGATTAAWRWQLWEDLPPHEVVAELEYRSGSVLIPNEASGLLQFSTLARDGSALFKVKLTFEAATATNNLYRIDVLADWSASRPAVHAYLANTARHWVARLCRGLPAAGQVPTVRRNVKRYTQLCADTHAAEACLSSVASIQQQLVSAMREGAYFSVSHSEGRTTFSGEGGSWRRENEGVDPGHRIFACESDMLVALRVFYDMDVRSACYPLRPSELHAWRLILRKLTLPSRTPQQTKQAGPSMKLP